VAPSAPHRDGLPATPEGLGGRLGAVWSKLEPAIFAIWCGAVAGFTAGMFVESMLVQTGRAFSAPLDDVFIHFDYARAAARGYPLQWTEGNGISSGNTSLLYPFTLAFGYWAGFREEHLMKWALLVAWISVAFFLWIAAKLVEPIGRWAKFLVPPVVLSLGALNWSLWSGMENAFHLATWALVLAPVLRAETDLERNLRATRWEWLAGLAGIGLVLTRPEAATSIAVLGLWLAWYVRKRSGTRAAIGTLLRMGVPPLLALAAQAVLNRVATGEWSQAGAIAKLAINHPFMSGADVWDEWFFHLKYVLGRNVLHHFADQRHFLGEIPFGFIVPALALVPLFSKRTRRYAILLWATAALWVLVVALNGQVRWQNERYTMAAVAWVFLLAAMGLAVLFTPPARRSRDALVGFGLRAAIAQIAVLAFVVHQAPNFRDQVWFYGRASRNIRDQHGVAGRFLKKLQPNRILVGDAGALVYFADRPGLDIIGLGGYHQLPFARAGRHGLGATLELIERMPANERPDVMAIYPSWWGDLPVLFGEQLGSGGNLVEFPVYGNVICGGFSKVVYRAVWDPLERRAIPRTLREGEQIVAELDVADLVSEKASSYAFVGPGLGYAVFRVLPDFQAKERDLFDAGRIVPAGKTERAVLGMPPKPGRLVVRTTATPTARNVNVRVAGRDLGALTLPAGYGWIEAAIDLPGDLPTRAAIELTPEADEWIDHHVWIVAPR
jgi:hypothetical protein